MISRFRVTDRIFTDLIDGPSNADTIALLRSAQLTKNLLLLRHLLDSDVLDAHARHAWEVLTEAHQRSGNPVGQLLTDPGTGAWLNHCVLSLNGGQLAPRELGRFGGLAAVGAIRAGMDTRLRVAVADGSVLLPTLGSITIEGAAPAEVDVLVDGGELTIPAAGQAGHRWLPAHRLEVECAGLRLGVLLDDLDPYRSCYRKPLASRLDDATVRRWACLLEQAWAVLVEQDRLRAAEIAGGLTAMVPLSQTEAEPGLSATSRVAFGALALTLPPRPEHLAATLVHEFQHSKLSALLDMLALYDPHATARYFAPWRSDPRPIGGLLQGAYAFLAVTDLWRRIAGSGPGPVDAMGHFTELREQVRYVLEILECSPHLTDDGREFVAGLQRVMKELLAQPAPAGKVANARQALASKLDKLALTHSTL